MEEYNFLYGVAENASCLVWESTLLGLVWKNTIFVLCGRVGFLFHMENYISSYGRLRFL